MKIASFRENREMPIAAWTSREAGSERLHGIPGRMRSDESRSTIRLDDLTSRISTRFACFPTLQIPCPLAYSRSRCCSTFSFPPVIFGSHTVLPSLTSHRCKRSGGGSQTSENSITCRIFLSPVLVSPDFSASSDQTGKYCHTL